MKKTCPSHKRLYTNRTLAEDALVEAHQRNNYARGTGPVNVYECEDCGYFHLTSKGEMLPTLKALYTSGNIHKDREAHYWEHRIKRK